MLLVAQVDHLVPEQRILDFGELRVAEFPQVRAADFGSHGRRQWQGADVPVFPGMVVELAVWMQEHRYQPPFEPNISLALSAMSLPPCHPSG